MKYFCQFYKTLNDRQTINYNAAYQLAAYYTYVWMKLIIDIRIFEECDGFHKY